MAPFWNTLMVAKILYFLNALLKIRGFEGILSLRIGQIKLQEVAHGD